MFKNLGLAHEGILFFRKLCEMLFHSLLEIFEIFDKMESLESCRFGYLIVCRRRGEY